MDYSGGLYLVQHFVFSSVMLSTIFLYYYKDHNEFYKNNTTSTVPIAFQVKVANVTFIEILFQTIVINENVCI